MKHEFIYKIATKEDSLAIMNCIEREYGKTYPRHEYYDRERLEQAMETKEMYCFLAFDENKKLAGMASLIYVKPFKQVIELSAGIVVYEYRQYPIFENILKYQMEFAKTLEASTLVVECVTNHPVSQFLALQSKFIPVNFIFNYCTFTSDTQAMIAKSNGEILISDGIAVFLLHAPQKVRLYVPKQHEDIVKFLYTSMGITAEIIWKPEEKRSMTKDTKFHTNIIMNGDTASVIVLNVGGDFDEAMGSLLENLKHRNIKTVVTYIDMQEQNAASAFRSCEEKGMFFSGILPNAGVGEFMVMLHLFGRKIAMKNIVAIGQFEKLYRYILDSMSC